MLHGNSISLMILWLACFRCVLVYQRLFACFQLVNQIVLVSLPSELIVSLFQYTTSFFCELVWQSMNKTLTRSSIYHRVLHSLTLPQSIYISVQLIAICAVVKSKCAAKR